jgi:hypothetical protein
MERPYKLLDTDTLWNLYDRAKKDHAEPLRTDLADEIDMRRGER